MTQDISPEVAQKLLTDFLIARNFAQWLIDNDELPKDSNPTDLAILYAGSLTVHREFLQQFAVRL